MISIVLLLLLCAFGITIASAVGKAPLWVAVILVIIALLLTTMPIR
jgi:hypothetical protein